MRALVTGASGFAGSHLCEHLLEQPGWDVYAVCLSGCSTENLDPVRERLTMLSGDLLDPQWTAQIVAEVRPEAIFHLAALASPAASFADPWNTLSNNIAVQVHLFQAILQAHLDPVVLVAGSGEEYGMVRPEDVPVDEDTPLRPANPYAVSKVTQDFLALLGTLPDHAAVREYDAQGRPLAQLPPDDPLRRRVVELAQRVGLP